MLILQSSHLRPAIACRLTSVDGAARTHHHNARINRASIEINDRD